MWKIVLGVALLGAAAGYRGISDAQKHDRMRAYHAWERSYNEELSYFIDVADTAKKTYDDQDERYLAVRALAVMKNPYAVEVLVRNLDWHYRPSDVSEESFTPLDCHPCADALRMIGQPAISRLLSSFSTRRARESSESRRTRVDLAVLVLRQIHGPHHAHEAAEDVRRFLSQSPRDDLGDLRAILERLTNYAKQDTAKSERDRQAE